MRYIYRSIFRKVMRVLRYMTANTMICIGVFYVTNLACMQFIGMPWKQLSTANEFLIAIPVAIVIGLLCFNPNSK